MTRTDTVRLCALGDSERYNSDSMHDLATLIGNAAEFPILRKWNYLNHAGVSPSPRVVADAVATLNDHCATDAYLADDWFGGLEKVRKSAAKLVNAEPGEIALIRNTAEAVSTVAFGLAWSAGDRVVTAAVEYPANVYPWMEVARKFGVELVMAPEETAEDGTRSVSVEKLLAAADHPKTKVLTLSHVQFASGQRFDLVPIGAFCRQRGILFNVDPIQSLGVLPVDVQSMQIDTLGACGHKWLCGPTGAGLMYIRRQWQDRVRPAILGASSVVDFLNYGHYDFTLRPDAGRYEPGTPNIPGLIGMGAAIDLLTGVGIDAIEARVKSLGDRFIAGLAGRGYQIISPRGGTSWSGMVNFVSANHDHGQIVKSLRKDHRIEIVEREKRLRASPHFYNTEQQVDELVNALP